MSDMNRDDRNRMEGRPIHVQVLAAARRLCRSDDWTFRPAEVVHALPHLNENSVRTHIISRCCENAPENHAHRWPYFRRVGRGLYEIRSDFRRALAVRHRSSPGSRADEATTAMHGAGLVGLRSAIHAVVEESEGWYVAECLETAVVTQGRSLDETLANLRDALELQLDREELARLGLTLAPRLIVSYETQAFLS